MEKNKKQYNKIIRYFILILTLISLMLFFLEDYSIVIGLQFNNISIIKLISLYITVFFMLEFIISIFISIAQKKIKNYLIFEYGWTSFLSSFVVFIFDSCPFLFGDILNIVNIDFFSSFYIIRYLRFLKIIEVVDFSKSYMIRRHIKYILSLVILSMVSIFFVMNLFQDFNLLYSRYNEIKTKEVDVINNYTKLYSIVNDIIINDINEENSFNEENFLNIVVSTAEYYENVYAINYMGKLIYTSEKEPIMIGNKSRRLIHSEKILEDSSMEIFFIRLYLFKEISYYNMVYFFVISLSIFIIYLFYNKMFTKNIYKPIIEMKMGFSDIDYIEDVDIPKDFENEEIFVLAKNFNKRFMIAKKRKLREMKNLPSASLF